MNKLIFVLLANIIGGVSFAQTDSVKLETKSKKFTHQLEAGWMHYENEESGLLSDLTSSYIFSYAIHPKIDIGLGIGYERYMVFNAVPFFIQLRGRLISKDNHPYFYIRGGKSYMTDHSDWYKEVNGSYTYSGGLGYQWKLEKASLSLSIGYKTQMLETINNRFNYYYYDVFSSFAPYPDTKSKINWKMQRVEFRIGVSF